MKKPVFFATALLLLLPVLLPAGTNGVKLKHLYRSWTPEKYVTNNGEVRKAGKSEKDEILTFSRNGSYVMQEGKKTRQGKWKYENAGSLLYLYSARGKDNDTLSFQVLELSRASLVIRETGNDKKAWTVHLIPFGDKDAESRPIKK